MNVGPISQEFPPSLGPRAKHKNEVLKENNKKLRIENDKLRRLLKLFSDMLVEDRGKDTEMIRELINQEEEKENNVTELKLIQGGKADGFDGGDNKNWLAQLEIGTVFLCRKIKGNPLDNPLLEQYEILDKTENGAEVKLYSSMNKEDLTIWVSSATFSNAAQWRRTLGNNLGRELDNG